MLDCLRDLDADDGKVGRRISRQELDCEVDEVAVLPLSVVVVPICRSPPVSGKAGSITIDAAPSQFSLSSLLGQTPPSFA